ncbi:hypothetical protein DFH11DRAFT_419754 [Phellopilus nigrolimitatus]|nr:hypothetical protein DFH11DRAFT_419754 [Phellopilus nigrolimitatus]
MIETEVKYFAPSGDSMPALVLQLTRLVDSYMLWIGPTDSGPEDAHKAPLRGSLCRDWACAMPPASNNIPPSGTALFRASASDLALAMAQRLARRFNKQIFLSIDLPPNFISTGLGHKLALEAERRLVETLKAQAA